VEIALRRLEGVAGVSISQSTNIVAVTYKPGTAFDPAGIREAVAKVEAEVVLFQIVVRGRIQAEGTNRYFLAGKDRFLLVDSAAVPSETPVTITGTVDDSAKPFKLKIVPSPPAAK